MENSNKKHFKDRQSALQWISELFTRYYNGQATEKEKTIIENWNPEAGSTSYEATAKEIQNGCDTVWQRLSEQFGFETIPAEKRKPLRIYGYTKYAVAAMVVTLMGIGFYFYTDKQGNQDTEQHSQVAMNYYESGAGEKKKMTLPDGSIVYMNSDTKIAVAKGIFNKQKREIWLEEGEAFFEVAKNPKKPFIVHSQNIETTVKGTSFNVKAYSELDESSVSVRDGRVEVRHDGNLLGVLTKNRQIVFNKKTENVETGEANWEDAAAWMDNRLMMKRANVKELKLRLKQYFGVEVEIQGNALEGTLLNSSFEKGASLKQVLEVISVVYNVKYDIRDPKKVVLYNKK